MKSPPCRLFVILAREAPIGVILRRGPAAWYHLIRWHTDEDRFEHGAWLRGRIYEERCDLSPDGELFLYFALQGSRWRTSYKGTWTAVSRPPWLHALVLWPHGDTWGGGGRFVGQRKVALWTGLPLATHPDHPLVGLEAVSGSRTEAGGAFLLNDDLPDKEWSGRDRAGEHVFTSAGKLLRRRGGRVVELADFNGLSPDPQPAPLWATRPLPPLPSRRKRRRAR
ncbi:MAG TPA: hypothetical protein VFT38_04790 [Vicinamibacteria bacterium]|nr:hypothetical protein [Vicinamibacteria bacterium]